MRTTGTILAAIITIVALVGGSWAQLSEEAAGKAAEQAGKYREALNQYTAALQKTSEGSADEQRVRESAIRVAQKIRPTPAISEEARRFAVRAQTWMKEARSQADFEKAAKEFAKASHIAPWWSDAYYNCGVVLEKAGKYNDAIRSYKLYLLASPGAQDATRVRDQIYALEVQQEKAQEDVKKAAAEERWRKEQAISPEQLGRGTWRVKTVFPNGQVVNLATTSLYVSGNQASLEWHEGSGAGAKLNGNLSGTSFAGDIIIWGCCPVAYMPPAKFQGEVSADGRTIDFKIINFAGNYTFRLERP